MPPARRTSSQHSNSTTPDKMDEIIKIRSAIAWRPSPGDMLSGTVVKLVARESDYGVYPVVVVNTGEPLYTAVHAFHTILRDAFRELKTKSGDEVVVVYQGKIESKNVAGKDKDGNEQKRSYHSYIVIGNGVDSTVEFDWDSMDSDDGPDY
jgi:hypothetical protein